MCFGDAHGPKPYEFMGLRRALIPGYLNAVWHDLLGVFDFSFFIFYFWSVFGQSTAQDLAQRPRLEKRYINQRNLAREIDSGAAWVPEGSLARICWVRF